MLFHYNKYNAKKKHIQYPLYSNINKKIKSLGFLITIALVHYIYIYIYIRVYIFINLND